MMIPLIVLLSVAVLLPVPVYQSPLPTDCHDVYQAGSGQDGVYTIYPAGPTSPVQVYCDMGPCQDNAAEKWTVIQRRKDGSVNFYRKWDEYKRGFGSAAGEYWLGLETMHLMTQSKVYELRVDMEDFEGEQVFAHYSSFAVGPESDGYKLQMGNFTKGAAGDSLTAHSGCKFSTLDKEQDLHATLNCARSFYGAFWYAACHYANPNGVYGWGSSPTGIATYVHWKTFKGHGYSLKTIIMKIRPVAV